MKLKRKELDKFREQYMKIYGILLTPEEANIKVGNLKTFLEVIEQLRFLEKTKKL